MKEKMLGEINFAEFGTIKKYPFLMGIQLGFHLYGGGSVAVGTKYTVNISEDCKWSRREKEQAVTTQMEELYKLLNDAKVHYVSELVGIPVEVTIENNFFKDFRILTDLL